jgi:hypothetical protein
MAVSIMRLLLRHRADITTLSRAIAQKYAALTGRGDVAALASAGT